jgi:hypothetical protein
MVKKSINGASAPGRLPPPAGTRFCKGQSGNPRGRPKGARSIEAMTRDFALRPQTMTVGGQSQRLCPLEIALYILQMQGADGKPMAVRLLNQLRTRITPAGSDSAVLLVPAALTEEEWIVRAKEKNRTASNPAAPPTSRLMSSSKRRKAKPPPSSARRCWRTIVNIAPSTSSLSLHKNRRSMSRSSNLYDLFDEKSLFYWEAQVGNGKLPTSTQLADLVEANADQRLPSWLISLLIGTLRGELKRKPGRPAKDV